MDIRYIERKIADLKFMEKDLLAEREKLRSRYLYNAEKHELVNTIIEEVFIGRLGIEKSSIQKYSQLGKSSGINNDEHIHDVIVSIYTDRLPREKPYESCSELSLKVRITDGFEDSEIRKNEKIIMQKLITIRNEINGLVAEKKKIKGNSSDSM